MPKVRKTVVLHPTTVTGFSEGRTRAHKPRSQPRRNTADTWGVRVDERVWKAALGLASDPRHIQVISATEVIVWNHVAPWPVYTNLPTPR